MFTNDSAVWCSAADTNLKLLDRVVSGGGFLTGGVFQTFSVTLLIVGSVAVLLYKIRCNPMHPRYGALPGLYVPVLVTRGALVAHRYTYSIHILQNFAVSPDLDFLLSVPVDRYC